MKKIILFDGVCHLCQNSVQFIIKRDPHAIFQFASLQSTIGKKLLAEHDVPTQASSLILLDNGRYYSKSTAVLKISRHLTHFWSFFYLFIIIPKPMRDFLYRIIARRRYQWFGQSEDCMIPTPDIRERFLD